MKTLSSLRRLSAADFPVRLLPSVTEAGTRAGVTARCWHGVPAGTPVTAAMGDLQCYLLATRLTDTDAGSYCNSSCDCEIIRIQTACISANCCTIIELTLLIFF